MASAPRTAIDAQPSTMPAIAIPRPFSRPSDRAIRPRATLPKITARTPVTNPQNDVSPRTSEVTAKPFVRCRGAGPTVPGGAHGALAAGAEVTGSAAGAAHAALGTAVPEGGGVDGSSGVVTGKKA